MAKVIASPDAPKGTYRYSLANVEVDKLPFKTDDPAVLSNAEAHPWLAVEYDKATESAAVVDLNPQLAPEDDAHSAENSIANDPKAVKAELDRRREEEGVGEKPAIDPEVVAEQVDTTKEEEAKN